MFTLLLTTALAAGQFDLAVSPLPPEIVNARLDKDDTLISRHEIEVQVPVRVKETIAVNGREVIIEKQVIQTVKQTKERRWSLKGATVTTGDGKKVEMAQLRKLLATAQPVIVSSDGRPVGASYRKMLAPNAIVIVARESTTPPGLPGLPPDRLPKKMPVEKR